MRCQFFLVPAAIFASAPALAGAWYLDIEQAQTLLFPDATFTPQFFTLTERQARDIYKDSNVEVNDFHVRVWRVSTGGWFFLDQVKGRDDDVTYAVALDSGGGVKRIEILECQPLYCEVRQPAWCGQFIGKHHGEMAGEGGIEPISGATLSSRHITEGVTRVLATFALVVAPNS